MIDHVQGVFGVQIFGRLKDSFDEKREQEQTEILENAKRMDENEAFGESVGLGIFFAYHTVLGGTLHAKGGRKWIPFFPSLAESVFLWH